MKIKFQGELSMPELAQAILEELSQIENRFLVRYSKNISLYMTPTNGFNKEIYCQDESGKQVDVINSEGPYKCAADEFDL